MQKQDLDKLIDFSLLEEFDAIILSDFCSKLGLAIKYIETSNKHNMGPAKDVWRRIKVDIEQSVTFSKVINSENAYPPVSITITGGYTPQKAPKWFSFTDFCAIFFPQDRFEVTAEWQKTLKANLRALSEELPNLYERDISVSIATQDIRSQVPNFWDKTESTFKHQFYASSYPIIKMIVDKAVSDITLVARWESDSPYQRFMDADKWGLISFRFTKRQQIDIVQYVESKKVRFKCALIDLGFLESGYGKVAKIKEVISTDVDISGGPEKMAQVQKDFLARVLKDLPNLIGT